MSATYKQLKAEKRLEESCQRFEDLFRLSSKYERGFQENEYLVEQYQQAQIF